MVYARWVLKMFTEDYKKQTHANIPRMFVRARKDNNFFEYLIAREMRHRFIIILLLTANDTRWLRCVSNHQSRKKFEHIILPQKKPIDIRFSAARRILLIEFLPKSETINVERYIGRNWKNKSIQKENVI